MNSIKLSLNIGVYEGISLLENSTIEEQIDEFIQGVIVTDVTRKDGFYNCTCMSPMYSGPVFNIQVPSFQLDMQGVRVSDIEQLSDYVSDYIRNEKLLSMTADTNEITFS